VLGTPPYHPPWWWEAMAEGQLQGSLPHIFSSTRSQLQKLRVLLP
jgi:hypothetical protein